MNKLTEKKSRSTLLTVPEAAQELRVSRWMIYKLIRSKELNTLTIRSRRLIATEDLDSFISGRKGIEHET